MKVNNVKRMLRCWESSRLTDCCHMVVDLCQKKKDDRVDEHVRHHGCFVSGKSTTEKLLPNIAIYCNTPMSKDGISFRPVHVTLAFARASFLLKAKLCCAEFALCHGLRSSQNTVSKCFKVDGYFGECGLCDWLCCFKGACVLCQNPIGVCCLQVHSGVVGGKVINVIGFAFDRQLQPDYKHPFCKGRQRLALAAMLRPFSAEMTLHSFLSMGFEQHVNISGTDRKLRTWSRVAGLTLGTSLEQTKGKGRNLWRR